MSAWDELRHDWERNTPVWQMSSGASAIYFALLLAFVVFFVVVPIVFFT